MTDTDFRPIRDKVYVEQLPQETLSDGGIIIPDTARAERYIGTVLAVGPGEVCTSCGHPHGLKPDLQPGDRVLFGKYGKERLPRLDTDRRIVLRYEHVMGVLT